MKFHAMLLASFQTLGVWLGAMMLIALSSAEKTSAEMTEKTLATGTLVEVACRFETVIGSRRGDGQGKQSYEWYLWREKNQVYIKRAPGLWDRARGAGEYAEVWHLGSGKEISHSRIFYNEKRILEFSPADLRILSLNYDWLQTACVIDPRGLGTRLPLVKTEELLGQKAEFYHTKAGAETEIIWLKEFQVPALFKQENKDTVIEIRLKGVFRLNDAPWKRPETASFAVIDYADLGDLEGDQSIRMLIHKYSVPHLNCRY